MIQPTADVGQDVAEVKAFDRRAVLVNGFPDEVIHRDIYEVSDDPRVVAQAVGEGIDKAHTGEPSKRTSFAAMGDTARSGDGSARSSGHLAAQIDALDDFLDGFLFHEDIAHFEVVHDLADHVGGGMLVAVKADQIGELVDALADDAVASDLRQARDLRAVLQKELHLVVFGQALLHLSPGRRRTGCGPCR